MEGSEEQRCLTAEQKSLCAEIAWMAETMMDSLDSPEKLMRRLSDIQALLDTLRYKISERLRDEE